MKTTPVVSPPSSVAVGPFRYRVSLDSQEMLRMCRSQRTDLLGNCDQRSLTILVEPDQAAGQMADTMMHEVLHAVVDMVGLGSEWGSEKEEAVVTRLSPALLDVLRRNPELVAYLLDEMAP